MKTVVLTTAMFVGITFAGCLGGGGEKQSAQEDLLGMINVSHLELSELSRITLSSAPDEPITYADLMVDVDGKMYAFGEMASFEDRRYAVDGKRDAMEAVESGDVLSVPAAGQVLIKLLAKGQVIASYEANIPDNNPPMAPQLMEPASKATGVSRRATFQWSMVSDPGGVSYTLVYSLDPTLQAPIVTTKVEKLLSPSYAVPGGKELTAGATYYWKVWAVDGSGNMSPASQMGEFTVAG